MRHPNVAVLLAEDTQAVQQRLEALLAHRPHEAQLPEPRLARLRVRARATARARVLGVGLGLGLLRPRLPLGAALEVAPLRS